jgi:hypothetical protein
MTGLFKARQLYFYVIVLYVSSLRSLSALALLV